MIVTADRYLADPSGRFTAWVDGGDDFLLRALRDREDVCVATRDGRIGAAKPCAVGDMGVRLEGEGLRPANRRERFALWLLSKSRNTGAD